MHEIKRTTCSQKADPWGPVLPTSSPQRAVVALCGFSGGWRGEGRQECSHPAWGGGWGGRTRYRLPGDGIKISFSQFTLVSMNYC